MIQNPTVTGKRLFTMFQLYKNGDVSNPLPPNRHHIHLSEVLTMARDGKFGVNVLIAARGKSVAPGERLLGFRLLVGLFLRLPLIHDRL